MGFMLARVQLKYGRVAEFREIMSHMVPVLEDQGWKLIGSYRTVIGRYHEIWDLWDLGGDASAIEETLAKARRVAEFAEWAARLPDVVEQEEVRYLVELSFRTPGQ